MQLLGGVAAAVCIVGMVAGFAALAISNGRLGGDKGGVVGKIRNKNTGAGIAGAKVVPVTEPSNALIRYLNEAGDAFVSDATSSSGIFVLVAPGLAEEFTVDIGGSVIAETTGKAGSASTGAVFMLILGVDQ